jgi:RNA polymerase sigma-70 factor, ECF subfamily
MQPAIDDGEGRRADLDRALVELRPRLHRYCARMAGSAVDGEDLVGEVCVKAIEAFSQARPISHIEAWLFRIAHNTALNFIARRARQNSVFSQEDPDMVADPISEVDKRQALAASLRTFLRLPAMWRSSVILKDVLGYSLEEIATISHNSVSAVKASLHRGRTRLHELSQEADDTPLPALHEPELSRMMLFIDWFNARDFAAVRDMLAEDVRLDLVSASRRKGRSGFETYFGNYGRDQSWRMTLAFVDRRPAVLVHDASGHVRNFILVRWTNGKVVDVRDFTHARYVLNECEIEHLPERS